MRLLITPLAAVVALSITGCGSESPADKIAATAKDYYEGSSASCAREGIAIFVGEREDVYGCIVEDVPPENRPIAHVESPSQRRCYIYTDGQAFDVTDKLADVVKAQKTLGAAVDEFPCLQ